MISGHRRIVLTLLALGLGLGAGPSDIFDLARLMSLMRAVKSSEARFTEERTLGILDQPIESTGTLRYSAPGTVEKHTLAPHEEHLIVAGDAVTIDQGKGKPRSFSLEESPELGALIESIRGTLSGDEAALERYYVVQLQGTEAAWQLLLTPRLPKVQALVDSIRVAGAASAIRTIETVEHGGDHTVMTITGTSR